MPPLRGAPSTRIGSGTRGFNSNNDSQIEVAVLAPDHTGLTTKESPSLFWFSSRPVKVEVEMTVIDEESIEPLLESRVTKETGAGFHELNLAKHNISLKPDIEYQWSVALIHSEDQRSKDTISSGSIRRVFLSPEVQTALSTSDAKQHAYILANAGIWYDAVATLSHQINQFTEDQDLKLAWASLLHQVGLENAAAHP